MAIYHYSAKVISRSSGRSAVAAAAYRSGDKLLDERQDMTHDYARRTGVDHSVILSPANDPAWAGDRGELWNAVE